MSTNHSLPEADVARLWDQEEEDDESDAGDHQGGVHEAQGPVLVQT